jgi:hypothetical protein
MFAQGTHNFTPPVCVHVLRADGDSVRLLAVVLTSGGDF